MVEGTATLVVDLGNSETRVKTYFGRTQKGNLRTKISQLSNAFGSSMDGEVWARVKGNSEYNEDNSRILLLNGSRYCTGLMQQSEFSGVSFVPTAGEKKYESLSTKLALHNAFLQGYEDIASWTKSDINSINVVWNVTVLLPAEDLDNGAERLAAMIREVKEINFEMPSVQRDIKIDTVNVLPEGFCALLGVIFQSCGVIREGYEDMMDKDTYTLIVDIGAGTTDISIARGGAVISNSRYSETVGGNNVQKLVRGMLRQKGYNKLSEESFKKACETGTLRVGAQRIQIFEELNSAKSEIAVQLVNAIKTYLELNVIPIQEISYLLVCGGGAITNEDVKELTPISNYLVDFLRKQSAGIELVELPMVEIEGEMKKVSPRMLNIIGAGVASESLMA